MMRNNKKDKYKKRQKYKHKDKHKDRYTHTNTEKYEIHNHEKSNVPTSPPNFWGQKFVFGKN